MTYEVTVNLNEFDSDIENEIIFKSNLNSWIKDNYCKLTGEWQTNTELKGDVE